MRVLWGAVIALAAAASAWGQEPPTQQPPNGSPTDQAQPKEEPGAATRQLQMEMKSPQVSINVREHQFGPDMVTVTALAKGYSEDLLRQQCEKIGELAGSPARGLQVLQYSLGGGENDKFTRATFATDNIIDRPGGRIRLEPLVRAFAGGPQGREVDSLMVVFDGERPSSKLLKSFADSSVVIAGSATVQPPGIEYRIMLRTQDPQAIKVPGESLPLEAARPKPAPAAAVAPALPPAALALILAGGLICAVLVYFLIRSLPRR